MDFNLYLTEYMDNNNRQDMGLGCVLSGGRALYQVSESEEERKKILESLKCLSDNSTWEMGLGSIVLGMAYFFLYDRTGEEQYKEKIDTCMKWLRDCSRTAAGVFRDEHQDSCEIPWSVLMQLYPFYMAYETRYHNKAEYADIVCQLLALRPAEHEWTLEAGWYLMTVIDVIDNMSKEIFEHYKSLEEIFKNTIRNILGRGRDKSFNKKESAMMGYSIVKACNLGVLNSEKYAEIGLSMIDGIINDPFDPKDSETAGIAMMAYAEGLILNSKQEVQKVG